jgi:predicted nucleic-acid-binding protein
VIALDTSILVRLVTRDDEAQALRAMELMASGALFVSKTVLIETEWVLRRGHRLRRAVVEETLRRLFGLAQLQLEDEAAVLRAFGWYGQGLDFADALHLASSSGCTAFATFDRALRSSAQGLEGAPALIEP